MRFRSIPHAEGSNVMGSVSPVELAVRETVFICLQACVAQCDPDLLSERDELHPRYYITICA